MTPKTLADTVISRCGKTARYVNEETRVVRLRTKSASKSEGGSASAVQLFFSISSKGGGKTEVYVDIGQGEFADILAAMVATARPAAMTAMSAELAKQLSEQALHDSVTRERARNAVVDLAKQKYDSAPSDHDDAENLVYKQVAKLAKELHDAEGKPSA